MEPALDENDVLDAEIRWYLETVELFRRGGCEPTWLPEVARADDACEPYVSGPRDPRFERRSE